MYYLVCCPICECSETEKLKDVNFIGFKCCDYEYEFSAAEAMFQEIDNYEINKPIMLPKFNSARVKSVLYKVDRDGNDLREVNCKECSNYNIGDGVDDISKCIDCDYK